MVISCLLGVPKTAAMVPIAPQQLQFHFQNSPVAVPDTNAVAGSVDAVVGQVYKSVTGSNGGTAPKTATRSDTGGGSGTGSEASGQGVGGNTTTDSGAGAAGSTSSGAGAAGSTSSGAGAAGLTSVLGDRIAQPAVAPAGGAGPSDISMIPAPAGNPAQDSALIAPAAVSGMNGPAGLSAIIIVIATATVAGAGVAQLRVLQNRRTA